MPTSRFCEYAQGLLSRIHFIWNSPDSVPTLPTLYPVNLPPTHSTSTLMILYRLVLNIFVQLLDKSQKTKYYRDVFRTRNNE